MDFEDLVPKNSNGGVNFDDLTPQTPAAPPSLKDRALQMVEPLKRAGMPFLEGAESGATLGAIPDNKPTEEPKLESTARTVGKVVGGMLPVAGAAMVAGPVAAAAGAGPITEAALGGTIYGAAQGAAQNKPIPETVKDMATQGATWGAMGAGAETLGYLGDVFGKLFPERALNYFLQTPKKLGEQQVNQGLQTTGSKMLETDLAGSAPTVLSKANQEIESLENQVQSAINQAFAKAKGTPTYSKDVLGADVRVADSNPVIDMGQIARQAVQPIIQKIEGRPEMVNGILDWVDNLVKGEPYKNLPMANVTKRNLYRQIGNINYLKQTPPAFVEAEMAVANGLKNKLEEYIPEIADINQKYGTMLEIRNAVAPIAARQEKGGVSGLWNAGFDSATTRGAQLMRGLSEAAGPVLNKVSQPLETAAQSTLSQEIEDRRRKERGGN